MSTLTSVQQSARRNIDTRIVVSSAIGAAIFGGTIFLLNKSNVKALKSVANVAKGGK